MPTRQIVLLIVSFALSAFGQVVKENDPDALLKRMKVLIEAGHYREPVTYAEKRLLVVSALANAVRLETREPGTVVELKKLWELVPVYHLDGAEYLGGKRPRVHCAASRSLREFSILPRMDSPFPWRKVERD